MDSLIISGDNKIDFLTHRPDRLSVAVKPLLRTQGYKDFSRIRPEIMGMAETMAARAEELATPYIIYRQINIVACEPRRLILGSGIQFEGEDFDRALTDCKIAVPFVLTLGEGLDAAVVSLIQADEILNALFLEIAGWICIEQATRSFTKHLQTDAEKTDCRLSRRLGPGYKGWDLKQQRPFFEIFAGADMPVRLMESCIMLPKKSRSGLYGFLPTSKPRFRAKIKS